MEVSVSTVTRLKLASTAARRAGARSHASTGASVVTTAIMVAMSGIIMPEPLDMAPTVKRAPG